MYLRIRRVQIEGFRGLKRALVIFPKHSVLLGANNCGKTAIVEAIALTLGQERLVRPVDDYDFYGGFFGKADPLSKRFFIKVVLTGFTGDNPRQNGDWFNSQAAGTGGWWDEEKGELLATTPECIEAGTGKRYSLAVEIGCCGFYDENLCEYQTVRYFVDGDCDPAAGHPHSSVPPSLLREIGVLLLPSRRTWDRALTFSASSFLKLLREYEAVPHEVVSDLRTALLNISPAPEGQGHGTGAGCTTEFGKLMASVESELKRSGLVPDSPQTRLIYRPTELDVRSMLASLSPHILAPEGYAVPLTHQGSGLLALQNLLLLIQFARKRKEVGKGLVFLLEEPELHLHPGLQARVTQLARGFSTQTIVTTHSPQIAGAYAADEILVLKSDSGVTSAERLVAGEVDVSRKNLVKTYFYSDRLALCTSIMGGLVVVPEGERDASWLGALKALAERHEAENDDTCRDGLAGASPSAFSVLRTKCAQMIPSVAELHRLGCRTQPLVDGDAQGRMYVGQLITAGESRVLRWADGHEIEHVVAWVLEPAGAESGFLSALDVSGPVDRMELAGLLLGRKNDLRLHEGLIVEAGEHREVRERAWQLCCDISSLGGNQDRNRNLKWNPDPNEPKCWVLAV